MPIILGHVPEWHVSERSSEAIGITRSGTYRYGQTYVEYHQPSICLPTGTGLKYTYVCDKTAKLHTR